MARERRFDIVNRMRVSVVIPAYNESKKIKNTFARLDRFFSQRNYEMENMFVEDGSSDGTLAILKELEKADPRIKVLANEKNMGKGSSLKKGVLEASGDYILFMDADMSTPLQAFLDFER